MTLASSERFHRAAGGGRGRHVHAPAEFLQAARWLEGQHFPEAAAHLSRAARGKLIGAFWTPRRLAAYVRPVVTSPDSIGVDDDNRALRLGAYLAIFAVWCLARGARLAAGSWPHVAAVDEVRVKRAAALLAEALLDATDPGWDRYP